MSEIDSLQSTVRDVCLALDRRDWNVVRRILDNEIYWDLSSYTDIPSTYYSAESLIEFWKDLAKSVIRTHHTLKDFVVTKTQKQAKVICQTGIYQALDESASSIQSLHGKYKFELHWDRDQWKVNSITFLFDYQRSNDDHDKIELKDVMKEFLLNEVYMAES
ncbi:nuclear transport factor 2 family protein [Jiulongibacter sp. NS-SX5]|uniref:nuclear transport factor 2 family protein n=1 Tax=Jiulongibacter sp. NS-SX5 TaxID=3463854 RepID=UPI004058AB7D